MFALLRVSFALVQRGWATQLIGSDVTISNAQRATDGVVTTHTRPSLLRKRDPIHHLCVSLGGGLLDYKTPIQTPRQLHSKSFHFLVVRTVLQPFEKGKTFDICIGIFGIDTRP